MHQNKLFPSNYLLFNIPIGAHDIYSTTDFYTALAALITSNMEVKRWIFRLNNDHSNESCVYLDVEK